MLRALIAKQTSARSRVGDNPAGERVGNVRADLQSENARSPPPHCPLRPDAAQYDKSWLYLAPGRPSEAVPVGGLGVR
jgi:hypothetical protein